MGSPEDRLDSWKEIAEYLKRDARTVQRWESIESLPVHRLLHQKRPTVYAFRDELDAWIEGHEFTNGNGEHGERGTFWRRRTLIAFAFAVFLGFLALASSAILRYLTSDQGGEKRHSLSTVTSYPGHEDQATFSPGGDQIAFVWDGGDGGIEDLWVKQVKLGKPFRLTETPQREYSPAWSRDGAVIAFLREMENGVSSILLTTPLGGNVQKIGEIRTPERFWGKQLEWSRDGGWLLTTDREPGGSSTIVAISVATGVRKTISTPPKGYLGDHSPALSQDGKLVFVRSVAERIADLYVYPHADDLTSLKEPRRLTSQSAFCINPLWLNSETILYSVGVWPSLSLVAVDLKGKVSEPLPFSGEGAVSPAYSETRGSLIFTHTQSDINIWQKTLSSASEEDTVPKPFLVSSGLDWLPEYSRMGDRIIFSSKRSGWEELWLSQKDGQDLGPVTRFRGTHCGEASWSPNDGRVAFHSCIDGSCDVYVKDPKVCMSEGPTCEIVPCCLQRITSSEYDDFNPSWSEDGKWIYYASSRSGRIELWKQELEGKKPVQVTDSGGYYGVEDAGRGKLFFTKSDQTGIWSIPIGGGDEQQVVKGASRRFVLVAGKIYYVINHMGGSHQFCIHSLDLASGEDREIATIERRFAWSLSVAPDASSILWAQFDLDTADLVLVEDFRM